MSSRDTISIPAIDAAVAEEQQAASLPGDLTDALVQTDVWTDEMLAEAGIPVVDAPVVSAGGGMGSFVFTDYLRVSGVPTSHIRVLGVQDRPWGTYEYLTRNSQIPRPERIRSDASSTPDNIWGFPSYAIREAFGAKSVQGFIAPLFQVGVEPIFTDYYTPEAGQVFTGIEKEAARINYFDMAVQGLVRMVRRRHGGGYFTILNPPAGTSATKRVAYRSTYVHLALGYPGVKFLPDLQAFRNQYPDHSHRVVNAYEPHEHVYEELRRTPGTVLVRGGGIVASRILQRLFDDRDNHGAQTTIAHLFRTYYSGSHGKNIFLRRKGGDGWAYQGFNWPKAAWGGQYKRKIEHLDGEPRKEVYEDLGGTNTPKRKLWQNQMAAGRKGGYYHTYQGQVQEVVPGDGGTVLTRISGPQGTLEIPANFIIDGTGLEADITEHSVLADLFDHTPTGRNPLGRLDVDRTFEIMGTRSEPGRMYAVGSSTLGGPYAGVDTFLGLQYGALRVTDDLAAQGFCPKINVARSISQWLKWVRNQPP